MVGSVATQQNTSDLVKIMYCDKRYTEKPTGKDIGMLQLYITEKAISIPDLAEALSHGASFKCGVLKDGRKQENWAEQQIFGLDFDAGMRIEEAYAVAIKVGLTPIFVYTTFSHTDGHNKFRMLFCMDQVITNGALRDKIQATFMGIYGNTDIKCSNRDRLFYGGKGKEVLYPNYDARITVEDILKHWKDEYAVFFPSISKTVGKNVSMAQKKIHNIVKNLWGNEHNQTATVLPFTSRKIRCIAKFLMRCLEAAYEGITWIEGKHRERFIFIYYNNAKIIYGAVKAYQMALEKSQGMQEPLSDKEFYWAIAHTDMHNETTKYHANGFYTYSPARVIEVLELTSEQAEAFGFYDRKMQRALEKEHQELSSKRDRIIAELYLSGLGYKKIQKILPEDMMCSVNTIKNTLIRLGIKGDRTILLENINFEYRKRYFRRVQTSSELPTSTLLPNYGFMTEECEKLYFEHLKEAGSSNDSEQDDAISVILSGKDTYMTGKSGTGKTYVLNAVVSCLSTEDRNYTYAGAPTGLAADNMSIKASTLHHLFKMEERVYTKHDCTIIPTELIKMRKLIIDEIGLLRVDLFDYIMRCVRAIEEASLRHIQVIVCGDFGQAMPVVTKEDRLLLEENFGQNAIYAFQSPEWDARGFEKIVLNKCRRVKQSVITEAFNMRCDKIKFGNRDALVWMNTYLSHSEDTNATYICATNKDVAHYNRLYVRGFNERKAYKAVGYEATLELAVGMRVITLKNTRTYKNGSIGTITELLKDAVKVKFNNGKVYKVGYELFVDRTTRITMYQLPIAVAGALTVNKAQGLTLDAVNIVSGFFSAGALYTTLTRCKNIENIHIVGNLKVRDLRVNIEALKMCV